MVKPLLTFNGLVMQFFLVFAFNQALHAKNDVRGDLIVFNNNGGWCWYQDERAIVHKGKIILGSIAHSSGNGGNNRHGNMEITTYTISTGDTVRNVLYKIGADDHNTAALMVRPDGRYLAVYATHGGDNYMRWNVSQPENSTSWGPMQSMSVGAKNSYSNVFRLSAENNGEGSKARFIGLKDCGKGNSLY